MGKQNGSVFDIPQVATPTANPAASRQLLYVKADGKVYTKNSAGTEVLVGPGDVPGAHTHDAADVATGFLDVNRLGSSPVANSFLKSGTGSGNAGWWSLFKTDVGLGNVDNTSDAAKPVSTATTTELNKKVNNTGNETIAGIKTFSSAPVVPDASFSALKLSATGTKDGTKYLRDDNTWQVPAGGSSGVTIYDEGISAMAGATLLNFKGEGVRAVGAGGTNVEVNIPGTGSPMLAPVNAATNTNITLSAAQTVDGVALVAGNRCLVKNQSTGSQNGVYVVAAGAWTRATDADTPAELTEGVQVKCLDGGANRDKTYTLIRAVTTVGTDSQFWHLLTAVDAGSYLGYPNPTGIGHLYFDADNKCLSVWDGGQWTRSGHPFVCTSTTRPASPFNDLLIYETDTKYAYIYAGNAWVPYGGGIYSNGLTSTSSVKAAEGIFYYNSVLSNVVGTLIIDTMIPFGNHMCDLHIKGYNYVANQSTFDVHVNFYATTTPSVSAVQCLNLGMVPLSQCRILRNAAGYVAVALDTPTDWDYISFSVDGYFKWTQIPDSAISGVGWSANIYADISAYTLMSAVTVIDYVDTMNTQTIGGAKTFSSGTTRFGSGLSSTQATIAGGSTNHSIELGRTDSTASTPFFDWHCGATAVDYDVRMIANAGTGVSGGGTLNIYAANLLKSNVPVLTSGTVDPADLSATGTPSASTYLRGDNTWAPGTLGGIAWGPWVGVTRDAVWTTGTIRYRRSIDGSLVQLDISLLKLLTPVTTQSNNNLSPDILVCTLPADAWPDSTGKVVMTLDMSETYSMFCLIDPTTGQVSAYSTTVASVSVAHTGTGGVIYGTPTTGVSSQTSQQHTRRSAAVTQSIPNGVTTLMTFPTAGENAGGITYSAGLFTVAVPGLYVCSFGVPWTESVTGRRTAVIGKNGSAPSSATQDVIPHASTNHTNNLSTSLLMAAGDTVGFYLYHNSGAALTTTGNADRSYAAITKVG